MTDPLAYESGQDHQLDVYEVLALVNEDALAGVKAAAEAAAPLAEDDGDLGYDWSDYDASDDFTSERDEYDPREYPDDDDFTFLPDYLRERG